MKPNKHYQSGQSMVEYTVILIAITAALMGLGLGPGESKFGTIGLNKNEQDSLLNVMHRRYTEQTYALSMSDLVEHPDYGELSSYYDSLDKYPLISPQLANGDRYLDRVSDTVGDAARTVDELRNFSPQDLVDQGGNVIDSVKDQMRDQLRNAF